MTKLEEDQLKVFNHVHNVALDVYNIIIKRTKSEFPELTDNEIYLVVQRISNRLFIQFNTCVLEVISGANEEGDL